MFSEAAVPCEAAKPESLNQNPHTALYIPIQPYTAPSSPISPIYPQQRKLKEIKIIFFFVKEITFFIKPML